MKKGFNVIQINGIRGLIVGAMVVCCLIAGFVAFPGWVIMHLWNFSFLHVNAQYLTSVPDIALLQGILLWGIVVAAYFTFRKNRLIVCMRAPQGLSEEEIKSVFADLKDQAKDEMILKAMMKANELELKADASNKVSETTENQKEQEVK